MSASDIATVDEAIAHIRSAYRTWGRSTSADTMRRDWDALFDEPSSEPAAGAVDADGVPAAWFGSSGSDGRKAIIYFHGGGFRLGSLASHRGLMTRLAHESGCAVLGIAYRLAPEHLFPAPIEDALKVYDWLLGRVENASSIALAGDSAGGGLALSLLLALRETGRDLPSAALLMSPWTDLTAGGDSYRTRADADPIHQRQMILAMAKGYLGSAQDARAPLASPLFADLAGLPPMLMQVGDRETVLDDSRVFAERARAAGVNVDLQVWPNMIHVFQMFGGLPDAQRALALGGRFLARHLGEPASE